MDAKHDTSLIKKVLEAQIDGMRQPAAQIAAAGERLNASTAAANEAALAATRQVTMLTQGRRAMWFAGAAALVLMSAGLAWRIAYPPLAEETAKGEDTAEVQTPNPTPRPGPTFPQPPATTGGSEVPVVTNYNLFRRQQVTLSSGGKFEVSAGHEYARSGDESYTHAWCYTEGLSADGTSAKLALGDLLPGGAPVSSPDPATRAALDLSGEQERTLFEACPWLPAVAPKAASTYRFSGEVTEQSVEALRNAVAGGATTIELDSPGGNLNAAMRAFDELHGAGLTMVVAGSCNSACTSLLAAGERREVANGGVVGVHQWSTEDAGHPMDIVVAGAQFTSAMLIDQFTRAGIAPEFFVAGAKVPHDDLYQLTEADLRDWNVVTHRGS